MTVNPIWRYTAIVAASLTVFAATACEQPAEPDGKNAEPPAPEGVEARTPEPEPDEPLTIETAVFERERNARFGFAASYPDGWQMQTPPANGDGFTVSDPAGSEIEVRAWGSHHMGGEPEDQSAALSSLMDERLGFIDGASRADVEPVDVSVQYASVDDAVDGFVEGRVVSYSQEGQDVAETVSLLLTTYCGTDYFQQVAGPEGSDPSVEALARELFGQFRILADEDDFQRCPFEAN